MRSVEEILNGLDSLFEHQKMDEVEPYLQQALQEAMNEKEDSIVITIVNELIGFYRDISMYEKSIYYCEQILPFMEMRGLKDSIHYATTCLNVANAYRAAGHWEQSLEHYHKVKMVYDKMLTPTDSLYASYYNNLSLLYQEMGNFEDAAKCLKTALVIIEAYGDIIKVAITCSNLAASLLRIGQQEEAESYLIAVSENRIALINADIEPLKEKINAISTSDCAVPFADIDFKFIIETDKSGNKVASEYMIYPTLDYEMGKEIPHTLYDKLSFAQGLTRDEVIYDSTYNCIATTGGGSFMTREKMDIDVTLDSEYVLIDLSDDELNELFKEEITARYE